MKIPIVTSIDTDHVKAEAMRMCGDIDGPLRDVFALGVQAGLIAIGQEFKLRLEALRLEMEMGTS